MIVNWLIRCIVKTEWRIRPDRTISSFETSRNRGDRTTYEIIFIKVFKKNISPHSTLNTGDNLCISPNQTCITFAYPTIVSYKKYLLQLVGRSWPNVTETTVKPLVASSSSHQALVVHFSPSTIGVIGYFRMEKYCARNASLRASN